jgi:ABC-type branched-subunit amino acid transport system ATPase component/ABC-type branched-subunit amino acid transport system permease subunit
MSLMAWAIAGGIAAYAAVLISPGLGFGTGSGFLGPELLVVALAAGALARMTSLPIALVGGVAIGVIEEVVTWNYGSSGGEVELMLVVLIVVVLLVQRGPSQRNEDRSNWAAVQPWPILPEAVRQLRSVRIAPWVGAAGLLVLIALAPLATDASGTLNLETIWFMAFIALSVTVLTGLGGQLSLGQFAVAGVGAAAAVQIGSRTHNAAIGYLAAVLAGAAISVILGLPGLRIRGPMFAVTSLAFALAANEWFLNQSWMLGNSTITPPQPTLFGTTPVGPKAYYYLALAIMVVGVLITRNLWTSGFARRLRAVRDNEAGARAFAIPSRRVTLQGYAVAGAIAGLGGAILALSLNQVSAGGFPVETSLNLVAIAVLGGLGLLVGPLLGALYIIGIPIYWPLDNAGLAASSLGWLILLLYAPGGLPQLVAPVRRKVIATLARRAGLSPEALEPETAAGQPAAFDRSLAMAVAREEDRPTQEKELLVVTDVTKRYGGISAVESVSLTVSSGEVLGLIGPNGAGKTTLFEIIGGFTKPDAGRVVFRGHDVSRSAPERRAALGMIRSFQDAGLFQTMTVNEVVMLGLERLDPSKFVTSALGGRKHERAKEQHARELVSMMGLQSYRDVQVRALSTGTRRIVELTSLVALQPTLLLLDEPSSGIAQRETEALGQLLLRLRRELAITLVIIEHDIPLITSLADRLVAMDTGRVVAEGVPREVCANPLVVASYLGTEMAAIARSDAMPVTRSGTG